MLPELFDFEAEPADFDLPLPDSASFIPVSAAPSKAPTAAPTKTSVAPSANLSKTPVAALLTFFLVEVSLVAEADFFAVVVLLDLPPDVEPEVEADLEVLLAAPFADVPPVDFADVFEVLLDDDAFPAFPADLLDEDLAAVVPPDALPEEAEDLLAVDFPAAPVAFPAVDDLAAGLEAVLAAVDLLVSAALVGADFLVVDAALVGAVFFAADAFVGAAFVVAVDFVVVFLVAIRFSPNRVNLVNLECLVTISVHTAQNADVIRMLRINFYAIKTIVSRIFFKKHNILLTENLHTQKMPHAKRN